MKEETKKIILKIIGIIFLFYGLFAMGYAIHRGKPDWMFWACYIAMTIIGIGCIRKNAFLIASQVSVVGTYLIVWDIDFLYQLIFQKPLWGITDYFFKELLIPARIISLEHLFLVPLSLYAIYLIGLKNKNHWKLAIPEAIAVIGLTLLLTNASYNVNCAFRPCIDFFNSIPYYSFIWMIVLIITILINSWIINKLFYKESIKIKK